ncbi:MAG TPA: MFS transporter [Burkholderiales bacterium]|nr:MFS transporter [Burkholderiales bacterium]
MAVNLIIALTVISFIGINASRIEFSLYALSLDASPSGVGGILSMLYVFPALLSWPIGALSDRFGARWLLIFGTACGALGMLVPVFWRALPALYIAATLMGITLAFIGVLSQSLIGILSSAQNRARNFNNLSLAGTLCGFTGPLIAGFAIDHGGHAIACLTVAGILFLGIIVLGALGGTLPRGEKHGAPQLDLMRTLADRKLWIVLVVSSIAQIGVDLYQAFAPLYAHSIGLSASAIGGVMSGLAVGSFSIRLGMLRLIALWGERRLLSIAFYWGAGALLLVPFTHDAVTLALVTAAFGMAQGCGQPLVMMLIFSNAEEGRAGEATGLRMAVNNIVRIFGPALFGAVGAALGLLSVFWINAALMGTGGRLARPPRVAEAKA